MALLLVGNVGDAGQVKVAVINSANLLVGRTLVIGQKIDEGEQTSDSPDASLIDEIVKGSLGQQVEISVMITDSANVVLAENATEMWIGKGTLMQEIVNVEPNQLVQNACLEVDGAPPLLPPHTHMLM